MLDPTPLSSPQEQADALSLAQQCVAIGKPKDEQGAPDPEYTLALLLWRAIKQIQVLTCIADPMAARFGVAAGHKFPELVAAGLGHLWQGPKLNDWHPHLLEGIRKHLKGMEKPSHKGACCDYIRNRLYQGAAGLGALELRFEEGEPNPNPSQEGSPPFRPIPADHPMAQGKGRPSQPLPRRPEREPSKASLPKTMAEMTEAERAVHLQNLAKFKQRLKGLSGGFDF